MEREAVRALKGKDAERPFTVDFTNTTAEPEKVRLLFDAMLAAKRRVGEPEPPGRFEGFLLFINLKTDQIRQKLGCDTVEFRVEQQGSRVRLTARAKNPE